MGKPKKPQVSHGSRRRSGTKQSSAVPLAAPAFVARQSATSAFAKAPANLISNVSPAEALRVGGSARRQPDCFASLAGVKEGAVLNSDFDISGHCRSSSATECKHVVLIADSKS